MKKMITIMLVLTLAVGLGTYANSTSSEAKAKKKYYFTHVSNTPQSSYGYVVWAKVKGNKLVIKGNFNVSTKPNKIFSNKGKLIKVKKRTFKLTKKTKYYATDPESAFRITKKEFKEHVESLCGLDLELVVKNGKVVKRYFYS